MTRRRAKKGKRQQNKNNKQRDIKQEDTTYKLQHENVQYKTLIQAKRLITLHKL